MSNPIRARSVAGWLVAGSLAVMLPILPAQILPPFTAALAAQNISIDTFQDTPLLAAEQSLRLARSRVLEQQYSQAIPPLLMAAQALAYFEQEVGNPLGADAGYLRQQIRNYANDVETDHQDAVIRIDDWLSQIKKWQ